MNNHPSEYNIGECVYINMPESRNHGKSCKVVWANPLPSLDTYIYELKDANQNIFTVLEIDLSRTKPTND